MVKWDNVEALLNYITSFGWIAVAAVIYAESGLLIGFFLPGDSLLFTAGVLTQSGVFSINIHLFVFILFIAAVLGNSTGYVFGHRVGRKLFQREDSRFFRKEHLLAAENFYEKNGPKTIIMAMFIPFVRTFTPIVAGISKMNYPKFLAFNLIGAALWTSSFTYIGYFAGESVEKLGLNIEVAALIIIAISLLPGVIHVLKEPENRAKLKHHAKRIITRKR